MRRSTRSVAAAVVVLALAGLLTGRTSEPASAQPGAPWDGNPVSPGLGPTYGESWCAAPAPGSSESAQQGAPLAVIPGTAIRCTLESFQAEANAAGVPRRMSTDLIGRSVQGRDLHRVIVNATETAEQRRDYQRWLQLRSILRTDPARAQQLLAQWGDDVKLPIVVEANIHGNEEEGTDAVMQLLRDLVTTPRGRHPAVDDLLDHAFLVVHPSINPDGRHLGTRFNANGFDMNRDLLVQGQPEIRASITSMLQWLPPVGLTLHGYTNMIQGMTKPHNPGYEYDLLLKWNQRRIDENEAHLTAIGMDPIRQVNDWNSQAQTSPPPVGPAYAEGWDDWGPFYTAGHASTWAVDLQTIEMCDRGPGCDGRFGSKRMQYVSLYSSAGFWLRNRGEILHDQAEIFRRNVTGSARVNCCDDPFLSGRGFTEEQHNWMVPYPEGYVIPAGTGQRSDAEANRLVQWLLDNGVTVERAAGDFSWQGRRFEAGSYVVRLDQAFRGLAYTVLAAGQDISDRIARLYAPPGAWSKGLLGGADVLEVPRGDQTFRPRTYPISRPGQLSGGVRPGHADWYAVTLRGQTQAKVIVDLLRDGVTGGVATEPVRAGGTTLPAGALVFRADQVRRLSAAGRAAGFWFEPGAGRMPAVRPLTGAPRVAVLVDSAAPAMNDTLWSLRRMFGADARFVSVLAGPDSLQNAAADPLRDVDVIYNAGQNQPAAQHSTARARLQAFFARGGGYIGTAQSANNVAFLNDSGLLSGRLTLASQPAGGGIARWRNTGASAGLTGGYPAEDYLYLPTNVTYFSTLPAGAVVDGRYAGDTSELFVAGLWRDRQPAAADAPVIVHGRTSAGSPYLAFATNPFSRGDAEREWPLIAQAVLSMAS